MGRALYRKYRSKKLSEIVGQEHVTTALANALKSGRIGHAYLFTGPRGTGKTSIARILAHEVNNLPYNDDATHLDIIEIDAASNRRIDEIRTLRERVHNAPTSAKYKVYIIDEVHMLTKEAFNALLKTLEEPPAHVIFILATTEAHKLPETIISRTQRYTFKPAEPVAAAKHLGQIAKQEGIDISDEALELVAHHGNGSFRDSISLLDQVSNSGSKIGIDDVRRSLGIAPDEAIKQLIGTVASGTPAELVDQLGALHDQGYQAPQIAKQLARTLRREMLDGVTQLDAKDSSKLMQRLIDVPAAHDPLVLLEIILLDVVLAHTETTVVAPPQASQSQELRVKSLEKTPESRISNSEEKLKEAKESPKTEAPKPDSKVSDEALPDSKFQIPDSKTASPLDEAAWQQILHSLKQQHNTLYSIARMAEPIFDEDKLTLNFKFAFHQKRMNDTKNKQIMSKIITSNLGKTVEIVCIVNKNPGTTPQKANDKPAQEDKSQSSNTIDNISSIFGGAEIME